MKTNRKRCTRNGYTAIGNEKAGILVREGGFSDPYLAKKYGMIRETVGQYGSFVEALGAMKTIIARESAPVQQDTSEFDNYFMMVPN